MFRVASSTISSFEEACKTPRENWRNCEIAWVARYIHKKQPAPKLDKAPDAMTKGLWFEERLIGGNRDGQHITFPLTTTGRRRQYEIDMQECVDIGKDYMKKLGIEPIEVQAEWIHEDLEGHPDLIAKYKDQKIIIDIKFTEMKFTDKFNDKFQWFYPQSRDHTQALHYVYLGYLKFGVILPFYYLVFGKSGWIKFIKVTIKQSAFSGYINKVNLFKEQLKKFDPKPCGEFNICKGCPFVDDCPSPTLLPEVTEVILE